MQQQEHIFFTDENMPIDDIDILFSQLKPIEPPPALVSRIIREVPVSASARLLFMPARSRNQLRSVVARNRRRKLR